MWKENDMAILLKPILLAFLLILLVFVFRVILFKTGLIYVVKKWRVSIEDRLHVYQAFKVPEFNDSLQENPLYRRVSVYLKSLSSLEDSDFTNLFTGRKPNDIVISIDRNQVIEDNFLGARVYWVNEEKTGEDHSRTLLLRIRKADKRRILRPYLQHIHTVADDLDQKKRDLKLHMNVKGRWRSVPFTHPSTFETIAMESDLKNKVKSDLENFLKAKQYYHRLGRVWRRSYLLYGPSGTGKSSFVAAMSNFLSYDVYEIDLSKLSEHSDLKCLLLQTTTKSVVLIEDLDRFLTEKSTAVSLSEVLNFMDGISSSCCGEERIMVFTMNGKDQVDSALLRPGRIDVHIKFPLCDFTAFKTLASSYLGLKDHKLFPQVEEMFQTGASLSAAEICELMIANRSSPSRALKSVISALQAEGDGRGARRFSEAGPRKSVDGSGEPSAAFWGADGGGGGGGAVKEMKKLYGLLRMRSQRKSPSYDSSPARKEGS